MQQLLSLPQTGVYGKKEVEKVTAFQKLCKLDPNIYGRMNFKTWRQLIYFTFTKGRIRT